MMPLRPVASSTFGKLAVATVAALIGIGVGLLVSGGDAAPAAPIARSWIDQPLEGAQFAVGPIAITAHATDPDGVARITVAVDGTTVYSLDVVGAPTLATLETTWTPADPGTFVLTVVAEDSGGVAGVAASTTFSVIGDSGVADSTSTTTVPASSTTTSTTSSVPASSSSTSTTSTTSTSTTSTSSTTSTTTPTTVAPTTTRPTTVTPTTAVPTTVAPTTLAPTTVAPTTVPPCVPGVPIPTSPVNDAVTTANPTFTWVYRGCGPDSFTIQVADNDLFLSGRGSYVVSVNTAGSARSTAWAPLTCIRTYYWRIRATADGSVSSWSTVSSFFADC